MAQRGYDDGVCAPDWPDRPRPGGQHRGREDRLTALEEYLADREKELTTTVGRVLDLLDVPEPRSDAASTMIAVIEGRTLSACLGRVTPERATDLAVAHAFAIPGTGAAPPA